MGDEYSFSYSDETNTSITGFSPQGYAGTVVIPESVTSIGYAAFLNCVGVTDIIYGSALITSIGESAFNGCTNLALTELPAGLTSIGVSAFNGCTSLTQITIPSGVTFIGYQAFANCSNLASITFQGNGSGLTIESLAFSNIVSGATAYFPESWSFDDTNNAFANMNTPGSTTTTTTNLPNDYSFTYDDANNTIISGFSPQDYAGPVVISDSVTSIGYAAFVNCINITDITFGAALITSIGESAFQGCTALALTSLPSGLISIGNNAFLNCPAIALTELPAEVTSIGASAFYGCTNLALASLPLEITSIEENTFYGCTNLALASLPLGLISIGNSAFASCNNLALTELPAGLASIGDAAFYDCINLALTELPAGVTTIGVNTFNGCTNLALTELPAVTSIGDGAFQYCTNLAFIGLPAGVTSIGNSAFYGCTNLALASLPGNLTSIGATTFFACTNLALTSLPPGITSIGNSAFYGCNALTQITIPSGVTFIGENVFLNCGNLASITFEGDGSGLSIGTNAFFNIAAGAITYVPASWGFVDANNVFANMTISRPDPDVNPDPETTTTTTMTTDPDVNTDPETTTTTTAPPSAPVCFFGNAPVLTPTGYQRIDKLRVGDSVSTPNGTAVINKIHKKEYTAGPHSNPYIIPKGTYGATQRLLISPRHRVAVAGKMVEARDLGLQQEDRDDTLTYYNLGITGWSNMIVAGVEVESLANIVRVKITQAQFNKYLATNFGGRLTAEIKANCKFLADGSVIVPGVTR